MSIFANQNKKIMKKLTILMVFCLLFAVVGEAFAGRTKHTKRRSKARTHLVSKGRKNHKKTKRVIGYVPREIGDTSSVLCEDTCSHVHGIDMSDRIDEKFERNIVMAHVHGLKVGSYHFYRPKTDQRLQLKNFISQCIPEEQDLIPMIDIETTNGLPTEDFCDSLLTFLELVEEAYQQKPLLYTFRNFYNRHLQGKIDGYKLMIAMYTAEEPVLADERDITMWQYTGKGRIMGVNGYVDKSRFMGDHTLRELRFKH